MLTPSCGGPGQHLWQLVTDSKMLTIKAHRFDSPTNLPCVWSSAGCDCRLSSTILLSLWNLPRTLKEKRIDLMSTISANYIVDEEISICIHKAFWASTAWVGQCGSWSVWLTTKTRLFKAVALPTLLYGSKTWVTTVGHIKHLQPL